MKKILEFLVVATKSFDGKAGTINKILPPIKDKKNDKLVIKRLA